MLVATAPGLAQDLPESLPQVPYHLTARVWRPLDIPSDAYLDVIERLCHFSAGYQAEGGAIIDPLLKREHQYATPYFAFAVGALVHAGRGHDLLQSGVRAMNHATACVAQGHAGIPDGHGEFFLAPLTGALPLYQDHVPQDVLDRWRQRLHIPIHEVIQDIRNRTNNWRTYAMKGEWLRYRAGLVDRSTAVAFIEDAWLARTQRERIVSDKWSLYQDWSSDPQSHAVEAVGRGNLLALPASGYDGPSAEEIRTCVYSGTQTALLLQDPSGQCPPNGRTDNHVFNDVLYQLTFEIMAEQAAKQGDDRLAGQYRRAARLSFQSIERWRRTDRPWTGSYSITKNHFDPADRVGYQPASQYSNYSGAVMYHLAEAFLTHQTNMLEVPTPVEIGGYALAMDPRFGSVAANAGGMQMFANLRGDSVPKYGVHWTPLGVVRFARTGWDSRLGPSDGVYDAKTRNGVTFGPTWLEGKRWVHLAEQAKHYRGTLRVDFVHPLLVRCSILYHCVTGTGGPAFYHDFIITPDGVLATLRSPNDVAFGVTLPLLENDGRRLERRLSGNIAAVRFPDDLGNGDEQCFIVLNKDAVLSDNEDPVQSTYGWLRPVRATTKDGPIDVFVFPGNATDPKADAVAASFHLASNGFSSILGRVEGTLYVGRASAGGVGRSADLDGDGQSDIAFSAPCGFLLQLEDGRVVAVETDRDVTAEIQGRHVQCRRFELLALDENNAIL
jgi:hypothetical protein